MEPVKVTERHIKYWIALQLAFGQASPRVDAVAAGYPSALDFYRAGEEKWRRLPGVTARELERLRHPDVERVNQIYTRSVELGYQLLTPEHPGYPDRLRNIYGIPAVLYVQGASGTQGSLDGIDSSTALAVVGTRNASPEGVSMARKLGRELGICGAAVVSGLAVGIDTAGHAGALESGGITIAVLGSGLDVDYPKENSSLKELIAKSGAVISEFPPGTPPLPSYFPIRNRLISALSLGVVLVEAPMGSGANITVEYGLDQGKDIFVIPWDVSSQAGRQAVRLLRQGAVPVTGASQVLEEYSGRLLGREKAAYLDLQALEQALDTKRPGKRKRGGKQAPPAPEQEPKTDPGFSAEKLDENQLLIYNSLENGPKYADELIVETKLGVARVMAALTSLELMGLVTAQAGGRYLRSGTCGT